MRNTIKNLPQKMYSRTILRFKEKVLCKLSIMLNGLDENKLTPEIKEKVNILECQQLIWPPISKICETCILANVPERFLEEKNGRRVKVIK